MRKIFILSGILIFIGSFLLLLFADTQIVYVNKQKVNLKEGPDETIYKTIQELKYREGLEVLELKDDWYKVKVIKSGNVGWVYKGKISSKKPEPDKSTGATVGRLLRGGSGSATTETAAGAGIRDFNKENYSGLKGDFEAIKQMESLRQKITDKDVIEFLHQGNLK